MLEDNELNRSIMNKKNHYFQEFDDFKEMAEGGEEEQEVGAGIFGDDDEDDDLEDFSGDNHEEIN